MLNEVVIDGNSLTLEQVEAVARDRVRVSLAPHARQRARVTRAVVEDLVNQRAVAYGVTTGFGKLSEVAIPHERLAELQVNLVRSHAAGVGDLLPEREVRAMMLLRANVIAKGYSGARPELSELLASMLNAGLHPPIPEQGSVGASGDLAPLAHLALSLIGEGVLNRGEDTGPAADMLRRAGLEPITLASKEGLTLINGTQAHTAIGALALADALRLWRTAHVAGAMSLEALLGTPVAFDARIQDVRGQLGQAASAAVLRELLADSEIRESHRHGDPRVQDAYALRCMPQVHGPVLDAIDFAAAVIGRELNAATDNPLVFENGELLSGGNFHGQSVAMALDFLAIALTNLATISERRTDRLVNPDLNQGLPAFLTHDAGVNSGFMMAQVSAAALASECKVLSHPASVDTIPTDGNKEDVVPMAMTAAWKLRRIIRNVRYVLSIELMCAAQGIDCRAPLKPGRGVARAHAAVRRVVAPLERDRVLSGDIERLAAAIQNDEALHSRDGQLMTASTLNDTTPSIEHAAAGPRVVRAPRGSAISCKGWQQEAALRMLMNNLDPEVAERPDDLVVYGGTGRAARSWEAFDAIVTALRSLENDETLLIQSGKPVGIFRTHAWSPRVLLANSNLVGRWANWEYFRDLERAGLIMYGQMTAGSWIYIGSQGILQGTYETFGAVARTHFGGSLAGRFVLTAGLGGMGGAQPLAATMNGAAILGIDVDETRIDKRLETGYCDRKTQSLDEALAWIREATAAGRALSVGLVGNAAEILPELVARNVTPDVLTDQTSAHDTLNGYVPAGLSLDAAANLRRSNPDEYVRQANGSIVDHVTAMLAMQERGAVAFDYGNNIRTVALDNGVPTAFNIPGFVPEYVRPLFCEGKGPFRWVALSGDPKDIARTDALVLELFPHDEHLRRWITLAKEHVHFQGLPARICWLGQGERARFGVALNDLVASGELSAPIVIGRDHLDTGSVASPFRETEAMKDGSDAIADWPILNALLNTASGASWVSFHHGGGVGIGNSLHAGQVIVADGTPEMRVRLERVLTNDPGIGVARHADAGYDIATRTADAQGIQLPMRHR